MIRDSLGERVSAQSTFSRIPTLNPRAFILSVLAAGGVYALYTMWDVVRIGGAGRLFIAANDDWSVSDELQPEEQNQNTLCEYCTHYCGLVNNTLETNFCGCLDLNPLKHCRACVR